MATVHINEAEAAADLAGLLSRVRAGEEVVIDAADGPVSLHNAQASSIHGKRADLGDDHVTGSESVPILEDDLIREIAAIVQCREPWKSQTWD